MSSMRLLWLSLGLAGLGFVLIWLGTFAPQFILWIGLVVFVVAMLLGPATRLLREES